MCETGKRPSASRTSGRVTRQGLEEVENILHLVEDATTSSQIIGTQLDIPQKTVTDTLFRLIQKQDHI